jgi:TetR/AcrR family transcriptional repressor of nem operon
MMARPREFDPDTVIEKAMNVFWEHGYEGASLPDLLDGMGLTRGSLYKAFKDKKTLYMKVLECYEDAAVKAGVAALTTDDGRDGSLRIVGLFAGAAQRAAEGDRRGCILCTAAAGSEMSDPEIAAAVNASLTKMRDGFLAALGQSAAHTHCSGEEKLCLANALLTQYMGLRVLARSGLPLGILGSAGAQAQLILSAHAC